MDTTRRLPSFTRKKYGQRDITDFLENVDDLTKAIKDVETPEIARMRAKVKMALSAAKSALSDGAAGFARQAPGDPDHRLLRARQPWQVVGIAAVIGVALGVMLTRSSFRLSLAAVPAAAAGQDRRHSVTPPGLSSRRMPAAPAVADPIRLREVLGRARRAARPRADFFDLRDPSSRPRRTPRFR